MVEILLKIGKQPENVGEEEVFGRFFIRDVTENPFGGLLRRPDIRRIFALSPLKRETRTGSICDVTENPSGGRISDDRPSGNRVL